MTRIALWLLGALLLAGIVHLSTVLAMPTAADRLIVDSPTGRGLIVLRALAPEPGLMAMARRALAGAQCRIEPVPTQ